MEDIFHSLDFLPQSSPKTAYGNARDHIRDDAAQYEYDVEIKLEEDA